LIRPEELRVVFMGTPDFALAALAGLIAAGVDVCGVFTQPDRPKGRGKQLTPPPVKLLAERHTIPVFQPTRLRSPDAVEVVRALAPDLIVVVAYGQILPQSVLDIPRFGCINVHASLLPKYRGAAPINQALVDGATETGVTTMQMDAGLDTGAMLVKRALSIGPLETAGELHDRLAILGREVLEETLRQLCTGTLHPEVQDDALSSYAPLMKKEDGLIDWSRSAAAIHNQVRGLSPWPGAYTLLDTTVLKLAATTPTHSHGSAGMVLAVEADGVVVACGTGALRIGTLQLPGKKWLLATEFVKGHPLPPGTRLGSAGDR